MEWQFVLALIVAVPIILFPAAIVWYFNVGGIYTAIKEYRRRRETRQKEVDESSKNTYRLT